LLWAAFPAGEEGFTEEDWEHGLGGMHFVLEVDGEIVTHASVVERELHVDGRPLRTGYVEAVATAPDRQGRGFGSSVMQDVTAFIRERFELGALGTGSHGFYERLGWLTWTGPTSVRTADGPRRTPDEDGYVMVLPTPASPPLDLTAPISCEWRPGDVW
jgi:aminoglycoside 2'-N-acetyltransferase I